MRLRLSLCFVLYSFASFSSSKKVPVLVVNITCPDKRCINIRTANPNDPPRRCCGARVDPPRITRGGQTVPETITLALTPELDDHNAIHTKFTLEGMFSPDNTGPLSTPGCIGHYDLRASRSTQATDLQFDNRYYLMLDSENENFTLDTCGDYGTSSAAGVSANPYYVPSLNPIQRAKDESHVPKRFLYNEPSVPSIPLNPGSSIDNPFTSAAALNLDDPLNPGIPIAQGFLPSQEIAPLKLASAPDFDLSPAGSDCTGVGCQVPPMSWSELNLNVRKKRTLVEFQA